MIKFFEKIFSGLAFQIGKFLFFVLLAIAICFLVDKEELFDIIGLKVQAAEINYSSASYQVGYYSLLTNSISNTGYRDLGNGYVFDGNSYLSTLYLQTFGNNTIIFKEGNTYTFTYLINFNPKEDLSVYHFDKTEITWYGNTSASSSGLSTEYISNGTINIENVTTGSQSNYQMKFTFSFSPTSDIKYTLFRLQFPSHSSISPVFSCGSVSASCPYALNSFNVVSLKINEETGTAGAIQNQTNIIINNQNENTDKVIDSITDDDTSDNTAEDFFDSSSIQTNDGVVSALLTFPIQLASSLVDNLGGTCTPYKMNFGMLGKAYTLNFPCIDLEDYLGTNLWHIIDLLFCGFMAYNISMLFVGIYDSITSLQDYYYSYIYQSSHEEHTRENRRARTPSE